MTIMLIVAVIKWLQGAEVGPKCGCARTQAWDGLWTVFSMGTCSNRLGCLWREGKAYVGIRQPLWGLLAGGFHGGTCPSRSESLIQSEERVSDDKDSKLDC